MISAPMNPVWAEKVPIETGFHQPNAGASTDPLHFQYCKTKTQERNNFYRIVEASPRGNLEIKNDYHQVYKDFQGYLLTTIDMVEHLPQQVGHSLPFFYRSGLCPSELNTAQDGKRLVTHRHRRIRDRRDDPRPVGVRVHSVQLAGAPQIQRN